MIRQLLATALLALGAMPTAAETIRFTFDTEADISGTLANNSWTQNEAGFYPGIGAIKTGLNTAISGYLDIERTGGVDQVIGFAFDVVTPHGVTPGFGNPDYAVQYFSQAEVSPDNGATFVLDAVLNIYQVVSFDPYFGPAPAFGPITRYDDSKNEEYPFLQNLQFQQIAGGGPDGGASWAVTRVNFSCYEYPTGGGGANGCNGYYGGNYGAWYGGTGIASSFGAVPASDPNNTPAVPLPAGLPLLLGGLGTLALLRRARH